MWVYEKKLQYPVNIKNPNPALAKLIISQYGGPHGELGASLRYLSQRYSMPYPELKAILTDIGTEELAHLEMIGTIVYQLTRNLTPEEIKKAGFDDYFIDHTTGVYPAAASGSPFTAAYIGVTGDTIADLTEASAVARNLGYRNRIVTLDHVLKNGDIVEILTSKNAKGPSRDWMKIAKSNEARNKIRQWFKRERREENIATGRALFESELKHAKIPLSSITAEDVLPSILRKVRFGTLDELYASIGYGGTTAVKSVARIKDELLRLGRLKAEKAAASSRTTAESVIVPGTAAPVDVSQLKGSNKHTDSGIIVEGLGNCLVKFAKCCTPVPGDPVIGFITRGYGVSVHRADCPNAAPENRKPEEAARWVRVSWVDSKLPNYRTALEVASKDRDNLTLDVAMALSAAKVKVTALSARSMPDGHAILRIEVEVRDKEELASVINKLNNIQGVYHVARMTGK